jgi:hypothetical protein
MDISFAVWLNVKLNKKAKRNKCAGLGFLLLFVVRYFRFWKGSTVVQTIVLLCTFLFDLVESSEKMSDCNCRVVYIPSYLLVLVYALLVNVVIYKNKCLFLSVLLWKMLKGENTN